MQSISIKGSKSLCPVFVQCGNSVSPVLCELMETIFDYLERYKLSNNKQYRFRQKKVCTAHFLFHTTLALSTLCCTWIFSFQPTPSSTNPTKYGTPLFCWLLYYSIFLSVLVYPKAYLQYYTSSSSVIFGSLFLSHMHSYSQPTTAPSPLVISIPSNLK